MNNRLTPLVYLFSLILFAATVRPASAETVVGLAPLVASGESQTENVATETTRTLELILRQLEEFDFELLEPVTAETAPREIGDRDFLIYGRVRQEGEATAIEIDVYSSQDAGVTETYRRDIVSALDLFNAADEAAIEIAEAISGRRIRLGQLRFRNTGSPGTYRVLIDGNEAELENNAMRVLAGTRQVQVVQDRMLERYVLADREVRVDSGGTVSVEFAIPLLTSLERRRLLEIDRNIENLWNEPESTATVIQLFERVEFLLSDVSYSTELEERRREYRQLREEFEQFASSRGTPPSSSRIEAEASTPSRWFYGFRIGFGPDALNNEGLLTSLSVQEYPDIEQETSVSLNSYAIRLYAAYEFEPWLAAGVGAGYVHSEFQVELFRDSSGSGLDLNGDYSYRDTTLIQDVAEFTLFVQPQLPLGDVRFKLRGGPLLSFGSLSYNAVTENYAAGSLSNSNEASIDDHGIDAGLFLAAGFDYRVGNFGFELFYQAAALDESSIFNYGTVIAPRGQLELGAYWRPSSEN